MWLNILIWLNKAIFIVSMKLLYETFFDIWNNFEFFIFTEKNKIRSTYEIVSLSFSLLDCKFLNLSTKFTLLTCV